MLKCGVCGCEFHAVNDNHYISRDNGDIGLASAFGNKTEVVLYDTYDCPACGCQIVAQVRKREYVSPE